MSRTLALIAVAACTVDPDRDGDKILNDVDECPDDPEDYDGFQDVDGCPDLGSWTATTMPARRLETAAGALGTRLVIAGGFSASMVEGLPITMDVLTFDTLIGESDPDAAWGALPPAPVAWTHANIAAVGGAVFLLGGLDGRSFVAQPEAFVLEAGATEWTPLDPLPEARGAAAVVASRGHIFLLGGASTTEVLATSLDFDLGTRTWSVMPALLPTARSHAAAMRRLDNGAFVIAGGLGDLTSGRPLADVFVLPQDATVWQLAEPMPEPRAGARGTVVTNRLYIPGGSTTLAFEPTDSLFVFAPLTP